MNDYRTALEIAGIDRDLVCRCDVSHNDDGTVRCWYIQLVSRPGVRYKLTPDGRYSS